MNVGVRRANRWWVGAAALGLLLAATAPADAATSVRTAGGAVLTVEEVGGPARAGSATRRTPRALAFTWEDATSGWSRTGLVAPTVDAAFDESPVLAIDPRSGSPILIWSRHDGAAMKLAWARFEAGAWVETRFLTFGPGNDRAPAVGTSIAGSYLFWRGEDNRVLHAPLDLGTGRLFASPRALPIAGPGAGDRVPRDSGAHWNQLTPQGGTDAPIIIPRDPPPINTTGGTDAPIIIPRDPPPISPSGGTDAPVVHGSSSGSGSSSSQALVVFSDPSCATQILLIGSTHGHVLLAVEFAGAGRVSPLGRFVIHPEIAREDAVSAAGSRYLDAACR